MTHHPRRAVAVASRRPVAPLHRSDAKPHRRASSSFARASRRVASPRRRAVPSRRAAPSFAPSFAPRRRVDARRVLTSSRLTSRGRRISRRSLANDERATSKRDATRDRLERARTRGMSDGRYSFSLTTFSPSGELVQIKHALAAIGAGATSLGIKAKDGVVLATEKKVPSALVDATTVKKIALLTDEIGMTYSGMGPDFRVLTRMARKETQTYYRTYKESAPVSQLVRETATTMQEFTQQGGVRPFGVSLLVAGYDESGPSLYQVDPSGSYFAWKASAIGKNMVNAKTFLEKRYSDDIELEDAIHTAILTLKEGFDGQISAENIEIGVVGVDRKFRVLTSSEIADYLEEVE